MIRIILLTCGTNANYHVAKTLKEKYGREFYIIGTDINKIWETPVSPYLDDFFQCPLSTDKDYYQFILKICKKENVDYLWPSFDIDQNLFYDGNPDLQVLGIKSLGIGIKAKSFYQNKQVTNSFLIKHGFPVPQIFSSETVKENTTYIVKPINGVGSCGVRQMYGKEIKTEDINNCLIEEKCFAPEITLECFFFKSRVYTVARQRLSSKSGICTKAIVYNDPKLGDIAQRFSDVACPPHIFNLQFMTNSQGEYVITDLNLRTAGGMSLSYAAGWDVVSSMAAIMRGDDDYEVISHVKPIKHRQYVMRAYTDIVTKFTKSKIAFDLDGTLLDSRARHQIVMDDVLKEFGLNVNTDGLVSYKAEGYNNIAWLNSIGISEDMSRRIQSRWIEKIEDDIYLNKDALYEGVIDCLKRLSYENDLYLVTARNNIKGTKRQLIEHCIFQFFTDVIIVKPNNSTSQEKAKHLKRLQIEKFIGDTELDLMAAQIAGCDFCAVLDGFRSDKFWERYKVDYYYIR